MIVSLKMLISGNFGRVGHFLPVRIGVARRQTRSPGILLLVAGLTASVQLLQARLRKLFGDLTPLCRRLAIGAVSVIHQTHSPVNRATAVFALVDIYGGGLADV